MTWHKNSIQCISLTTQLQHCEIFWYECNEKYTFRKHTAPRVGGPNNKHSPPFFSFCCR